MHHLRGGTVGVKCIVPFTLWLKIRADTQLDDGTIKWCWLHEVKCEHSDQVCHFVVITFLLYAITFHEGHVHTYILFSLAVCIARTLLRGCHPAFDFLCCNAKVMCFLYFISASYIRSRNISSIQLQQGLAWYKSVCYGFTYGPQQLPVTVLQVAVSKRACVVDYVHMYHLGLIAEFTMSSSSHSVAWFCPSLRKRLWSCILWCPDTHAALMIDTQFTHSKLECFSIHKIYTVVSKGLRPRWKSASRLLPKVSWDPDR